MKIFKVASFGVLLTIASLAFAEGPEFRQVKLEEFTGLTLYIMPDLGTQLTFPFKLDNPEMDPSLKIRLTNNEAFYVPTDPGDIENLLKGHNTITVMGKYMEGIGNGNLPEYRGNLFITIGGFNISINLITTYNMRKHVSNVVFNIDDKQRNYLLENMVKNRVKALEDQYKNQAKNVDRAIDDRSLEYLAKVARVSPSSTRFKEEADMKISGSRIIAFVDRTLNYDDSFFTLLFELDNKSNNDFLINGIDVIAIKDNVEENIIGALDCPDKLSADSSIKCAFSSSKEELKSAPKLKLVIKTDRGQGAIQW